jgi:hypothetical protein
MFEKRDAKLREMYSATINGEPVDLSDIKLTVKGYPNISLLNLLVIYEEDVAKFKALALTPIQDEQMWEKVVKEKLCPIYL